jgi:phosphoethanolamine N-methyltransferase
MSEQIRGTGQYDLESLRRYEWIFGENFLSSGAQETAHEAAQWFGLRPGMRVLDAGSGLGGTAFLFAGVYGSTTTGVDVLSEMVDAARTRARLQGVARVEFVAGDIASIALPPQSYDAIYSKDAFLHIHDKRTLMERLFYLLAPGGRLFFTDYLRGTEQGGEEFESYAAASGYALATAQQYTTLLSDCGFACVAHADRTPRLVQILRGDLEKMRGHDGANAPGIHDLDYLIQRWELKLRCQQSGEMKWGRFTATRNESGK